MPTTIRQKPGRLATLVAAYGSVMFAVGWIVGRAIGAVEKLFRRTP
jgi:hypothetical protein